MKQDIQPIDERDIHESLFFLDKEWCVLGEYTDHRQRAADRLWNRIDHGNLVKIKVKKRVKPVEYTATDGTVHRSKPVGDLYANAIAASESMA